MKSSNEQCILFRNASQDFSLRQVPSIISLFECSTQFGWEKEKDLRSTRFLQKFVWQRWVNAE